MNQVDGPQQELPKKGKKRLMVFYALSKRSRALLLTTLALFLIAFVVVFYWWIWWRFEEYTDDAYVGGNMVLLTPQVRGIISKIYTDDNLLVEEGQLLIELDRTDARLLFELRKAELAEKVREVIALFKKVDEIDAQLSVRRAELKKAELDFIHRDKLLPIGGVSREDYEHAEIALEVAFAQLHLTQFEFASALAQIVGTTVDTHPLVDEAKRALRQAYVDLQRCALYAPVKGIISQRVAQVGKQVEVGQRLLDIIPLDQIWIDANYKEVQLKKIRLGQRAEVSVDMYGDSLVFHGQVQGLCPGTGSAFSLLPPQNATGNWIKIVQRLPVRITLDPKEVAEHPLWLGLSAEVTVDLHDEAGRQVPLPQLVKPYYQTDVYGAQQEGVEEIIQEIIKKNGG